LFRLLKKGRGSILLVECISKGPAQFFPLTRTASHDLKINRALRFKKVAKCVVTAELFQKGGILLPIIPGEFCQQQKRPALGIIFTLANQITGHVSAGDKLKQLIASGVEGNGLPVESALQRLL
jgi:hypothetical protein